MENTAQVVQPPVQRTPTARSWFTISWVAIALLFLIRLVIAFLVPLGEDEAYYWGWSRHLALGYIDHPPLVAWLIAAFSWLGRSAGVIRLGFILCGAVAAIALYDCATVLSDDRRAGVVAALAFSLTPFVIGQALPDAPLIAFWALSLALAVRMMQRPTVSHAVLLGLTLAGALLSKMLGFALLAGIIIYTLAPARRTLWSRGFAVVPAVVVAAYFPFLWWNAHHAWVSFTFAFHTRNAPLHAFSLGSSLSVIAGELATYSPGLWLAALVALFAPRSPLVFWTAAPLAILVTILSPFENVQAHWLMGPYVSLCVALGLNFIRLHPAARTTWSIVCAAPAGIIIGLVLFVAAKPQYIAQAYAHAAGVHAPDNGPFAYFGYKTMAISVRKIAEAQHASVMTDEFGLAAEMLYHANLPAVVIGTDVEGRETRRWATLDPASPRALIVSKYALASSETFSPQLARACATVRSGPVLRYRFESAPAGTYYLTWCDRPKANALSLLRWERERP